MKRISLLAASALACLALGATLPALNAIAQTPPAAADALTDPAMKGPEVIAFIGVKPGWKVADIVAGRFVRALSQAAGPKGKLYAVMPAEVIKAHPEVEGVLKKTAANPAYGNVTVLTPPVNAMDLPKGLDAVFIRQNYHDLYDKFMGPADVPGFNKQVFAALKPGGVYVILDHADAPGTGLTGTETRHRIEEARVKEDVLAAGFKLDAESPILANPADDHSKMVFNPAIRGKTDQFLLRFKKPR
jgi:predicted methyltransferase